jgi:hypothetical protein
MRTVHSGFKQCARGEHSLVIAILVNTSYSPMAALVDDRQCNVPHEDPRI